MVRVGAGAQLGPDLDPPVHLEQTHTVVITTRSVGVTTTGVPVRTDRPSAEWSGVPRVGSAGDWRAAGAGPALRFGPERGSRPCPEARVPRWWRWRGGGRR